MLTPTDALPVDELEQELRHTSFTPTVLCPYFSTGEFAFRLLELGHKVVAADKNVYRVNFWHCMQQSPRRVWDQVARFQVRSLPEVRAVRRQLRSGRFPDKFCRAAAYFLVHNMYSQRQVFLWNQTRQEEVRQQMLRYKWPKNLQLYYGDPVSLLQRFPKMSAFVHCPKKQAGNMHLLHEALNAPGRTYIVVAPDDAVTRTRFRHQTLKYFGGATDSRLLVTK